MKALVTGVTGFVGKVVLEELLRRSEEMKLEKVYVLIRPGRKGHTPQERFEKEVAASPCFSKLSPGWAEKITVVAGELSESGCALSLRDRDEMTGELTHIFNVAASVEFDLPLEVAARANIASSLNVLEFAKSCPKLERFVGVSTAYVTPHRGNTGPIEEKAVALPRPARDIYNQILSGRFDTKALLKETGHPNTYTLTKCLAEHLLLENRGSVPFALVRPSIVSACWSQPFAGWIDSRAAFAGFVSLIGAGYLRAVVADYDTQLDIVPCDVVADCILRSAIEPLPADGSVRIVHAVAGKNGSCNIRENIAIIESYFRRYPVARFSHLRYVGPNNLRFKLRHWQWQLGPGKVAALWFKLKRKEKARKQIAKLTGQLHYLNTGFPYFTHCTFDFRSSMPIADPKFRKYDYIENVCRGVYLNLMHKKESEVVFAGRRHAPQEGDFRWSRNRARGNWAIRSAAYLARKVLRRSADSITFDRGAFEQARRSIPEDTLLLIVPTHRSYLDFILCSYLFFAYPELGIPIPHIAAAQEFGKIPVLGRLIRQTQAFYVQRGLGKENPELTRQIHDLVRRRQALEFFIEGTRSRSRQPLTPRRGILKCLQATGQACTLLPISISYDRVPEESTFKRELSGEAKPKMRLGALLAWLLRVVRGEIRLGRIHVGCGRPIALNRHSDLNLIGAEAMSQLQKGLVATEHHLRAFAERQESVAFEPAELRAKIEERGGRVLASPLKREDRIPHSLLPTLNYQWSHYFFAEALALFPDNPAVQSYVRRNDFSAQAARNPSSAELADEVVQLVVFGLFEGVCRDYFGAADWLGRQGPALKLGSAAAMMKDLPDAHLPNIEGCLEDLLSREILVKGNSGEWTWGANAAELNRYREACRWPEKSAGLAFAG
jgi:alcohol-forming fatty acyl-CoA reductase